MNVALVDDEVEQIQRLRELVSDELLRLMPDANHRIDGFRGGQVFLDHFKPGEYDVIVLDIFMGGITGVEVARKIREDDEDVKLVFCSRSNEFAAESYQVNAQYYLVKPATKGSVGNMFRRLNLELIDLQKTISLPDGHAVILRNILYTEYYNHVITIYMKDGENHRIRTTHAQMEELLMPSGYFCSPNKGVLMNFHEVDTYLDDVFTMTDGSQIHVSRRKSKDIQAAYTKFRFQKMRREVEV